MNIPRKQLTILAASLVVIYCVQSIPDVTFDSSIRSTCSNSDVCCLEIYKHKAPAITLYRSSTQALIDSALAEPLHARDTSWFSCRSTSGPTTGEPIATGPWRLSCPSRTLLKVDTTSDSMRSGLSVRKAICHEVQQPIATLSVGPNEKKCVIGTWQWSKDFTGVQASISHPDHIYRAKVPKLTIFDEAGAIVADASDTSDVSFITMPEQQGHHFHACVDKPGLDIILTLSWYRVSTA